MVNKRIRLDMKSKSILVFAVLLLDACIRESILPEENGLKTFDCFTVSVEESSMTKVHMEDGGAVKWNAWDCIGVYSDIQGPVMYFRGEDGRFRGEPVTGNTFYAFYPWNNFEFDENNPGILKAKYPVSVLDGDHASLPMIAVTQENSLSFKQTSGLIHLIIKSSRSFSTAYFIAGVSCVYDHDAGQVDLSDSHPALPPASQFVNYYSLGEVTEPGREFYISLPPMTIKGGFTVAVNQEDTGEYIAKSTSKDVLVERGKMITYTFDVDKEDLAEKEHLNLEREALIAFYNALDGNNWVHNDNWCSDKPVGEWYGVHCTSEGTVNLLQLISNNLSGTIPDSFGVFKDLFFLNLAYNQIEGAIPESIGNLSNLEYLDLACNRLSGTLPESMKNLKRLKDLHLYGTPNQDYPYFNGPLPSWIGELTQLEYLQFSCNKLSGELPESLSNLVNLKYLLLDNNELSGPLPDLSKMSKLVWAIFEENNFSGAIPVSLASQLDNPNLKWFEITNNRLSGRLPAEIENHPNFSEWASQLLIFQQPGYKIEVDETKVPACRHSFETLEGGTLNLGEQYSKAEYTIIARWAEWCTSGTTTMISSVLSQYELYKDRGLQLIWAYAGGDENERKSFMEIHRLNESIPCIIECYQSDQGYNLEEWSKDHGIWENNCGLQVPFVEVVDKNGNVVFIDDTDREFSSYSFSYNRMELPRFLMSLFGEEEEIYQSTDFSADGTPHTLQTATKGEGINVVLMGDAFSDRLIADGTYESVMQKAMEALFSEEPYKTYRDYFNVFYVDVVSTNEVYYGDTALGTWYGTGTNVGGNDGIVLKYTRRVLSEDQMPDALVVVMINHDHYAGTCYEYLEPDGDYGRGLSISYFPACNDAATFNALVSHEAGGHGFAKLADEYSQGSNNFIPENAVKYYESRVVYGWWKNIDFVSDPTEVKWAKFIADNRYLAEGIGVFEGACTYWKGAYRPTEESIMNHNTGGFNAPSRYAIWYRINKLAFGADWSGTYEDFVTWDLAHRTPASISARNARKNFVEREFKPLAPPVVINKDWREVVKK